MADGNTPDMEFLASVQPEKTQLLRTKRGRDSRPNPMVPHLRASVADATERQSKNKSGIITNTWYGAPLQIQVRADQARYVENLTRQAANELGCGVTVQFKKNKNDADAIDRRRLWFDLDEDAEAKIDRDKFPNLDRGVKVWVVFAAKERTQRNPSGGSDDADTTE